MKLKHGKKYETADGVVYQVRKLTEYYMIWDVSDDTYEHWDKNGKGFGFTDLIRRHYTKPQPAHKLDLKPGDVVELVAWEDGTTGTGNGEQFNVGNNGVKSVHWNFDQPKGHRPLFRVVSRA